MIYFEFVKCDYSCMWADSIFTVPDVEMFKSLSKVSVHKLVIVRDEIQLTRAILAGQIREYACSI